jgi:hypothetical protein
MMREPRFGASNSMLKEIMARNQHVHREAKRDGRGRSRRDGLVGGMATITAKELDVLIIRIASAETDNDHAGGLSSDLDSAIEVMRRRVSGEADIASMGEWLDLNYPKKGE